MNNWPKHERADRRELGNRDNYDYERAARIMLAATVAEYGQAFVDAVNRKAEQAAKAAKTAKKVKK